MPSPMMFARHLASLLLVCVSIPATVFAGGPPKAAEEPVVDSLFGVSVSDPYRWMEDRFAPRFADWAKAENAYARAALDRIPKRDELVRRVADRTAGGVLVGRLQSAGGKVFYLKRLVGDNTSKLYVRDLGGGDDRLLVDPEATASAASHFAIDWFAPSSDGARVVYGLSPGGSEASVMHVLDVASGVVGPEAIDRTEYGSPSWSPDGKSLFYNRLVELRAGAKETDKYQNSRVFLHRVGDGPDRDVAIAGTGVAGSPKMSPVDVPFVIATPGSPYLLLAVSHGASPALSLFIADRRSVGRLRPAWRAVATAEDQVTDAVLHGRRLFLLSHRDAPRYRILEVDAARPDIAHAKVVVPEGKVVVQALTIAADALYLRDLDGGPSRLRRFDLSTGVVESVALPIAGSITDLASDPLAPGVVFGMQGWVVPPRFFATRGGTVSDIALAPPWREDLGDYTVEEVAAQASDGTAIPLSIVYRKGLVRDGTHPVWLTGYGAYGVALRPSLAARYLPLLDDGGVFAVAHVRGGGEFGEQWHEAGRLATKPNSHRDLIACAEYLVAQRYGSPATLAIEGRSAGGITVGMALTERPDLFRVVFSGVGDSNPLRSEFGTDGPANALEYGSIATEAGFKALLAVDATQHVRPGVDYPAVLLTSGFNDPRVAPWQPGKMAARLQAANPDGRPVLFLVDFDAGHGMGSTKAQRDNEMADQMAFFYWQIGKPDYQP